MLRTPAVAAQTAPLGTVRYALVVRLGPTGHAWQATRNVSARE